MKALFATSIATDGPMGSTSTLNEVGKANRAKFVKDNFGDGILAPVMLEQTHSPSIHVAIAGDAGSVMQQCDGLYTETPNLPIMITHQDCVPVTITDTAQSFVCVLHAGWKGTLAAILPRAIDLCKEKGKKVEDLHVNFGPGIQPCHFIVKEDVASRFRTLSKASVIELAAGVVTVNLYSALHTQAKAAGVHPANIKYSAECTFHDPGYFSWRRDHNRDMNMVTVGMLMP